MSIAETSAPPAPGRRRPRRPRRRRPSRAVRAEPFLGLDHLGLLLRSPQAVMSAGTVVLFPLTLASNVFVRPQTMPGWLQAFVTINPVSHLVTAERALMAGQAAAGQVAFALITSAALIAVFAPVTVYLYGRQR